MKKTLILFCALTVLAAMSILTAPVPSYRAQRYFFGYVLSPLQKIMALKRKTATLRFTFEDPKNLRLLRKEFYLDSVVAGASNDFDSSIRLMHWVRDQFPHAIPATSPPSQSFDGVKVLREKDNGYLCGTASQLLVQAVTSLGGAARRAELRFTPGDQHAVVEVWSSFYGKWFIADPDYDIYYTINGVPQNALELHRVWAEDRASALQVHWRESPHNIYRADLEGMDSGLIRSIYSEKAWEKWDGEIKMENPEYHQQGRFFVKLLNYYSHISFPLRNDWFSRPLPWWHPDANHVTASLVIQLSTLRNDEDFLLRVPAEDGFYGPPITSLSEGL